MQLKTLMPEQKTKHQKWIKHFEDKYQFRFFDPTYSEVPNVSQFFVDENKKDLISRLEYYLLGTYPIDMGTNVHQEMHDLRHFFSKEEYQLHKKLNKLGFNCWGTQAGPVLIGLNQFLNRDDLSINPFPETEGYDSMSFDQKLELCIYVDKNLYSILEKLYVEYS